MKYIVVALFVSVATIGLSVWILGDDTQNYEAEVEESRSVSFMETFSATNYDITPESFACDTYEVATETDPRTLYGCEFRFDLINTTEFDLRLGLDGDKAVTSGGIEYESSEELSRELLENDALDVNVKPDESVEVGQFYETESGAEIDHLEIREYVNKDPIIVELPTAQPDRP